jgi:hypothetical protein
MLLKLIPLILTALVATTAADWFEVHEICSIYYGGGSNCQKFWKWHTQWGDFNFDPSGTSPSIILLPTVGLFGKQDTDSCFLRRRL